MLIMQNSNTQHKRHKMAELCLAIVLLALACSSSHQANAKAASSGAPNAAAAAAASSMLPKGQNQNQHQQQQQAQQQQQQQQQQVVVPNGAQLFQSPAALAALAAAAAHAANSAPAAMAPSVPTPAAQAIAAAAASATSGAQLALAPVANTAAAVAPIVVAAAVPASPSVTQVSSLSSQQQQQQQQQQLSSIAARVDTNELLKQQQQAAANSNNAANSAGMQMSPSSSQQQQQQQGYNFEQDCAASNGFISFELITGYVLGAPAESMLMQPGTLQLTDCLNLCRQNSSCLAINFETGLCVLLQESADKNPQALQKSQFPVFTIYAHKICLQGDRMKRCHSSWSFERVIGWVLNNLEKKTIMTKTRLECLQACYAEQAFQCKSFNYDSASGSCSLSDMDRHSLPTGALKRRHYVESSIDTIDYGENNCIQEARGICDFKPVQNRILKTVDSIYQDIKSEPECRKRCLQASYRCHSYDLGDSSNPVCRTSHLDRTSLQQIQEPYLDIQGAVSYELDSCYNVTVQCKSREMIARVRTNKLFNGKIYAKNAPLSCMNDISNSMDFELQMAFNDNCAIQRSSAMGVFSNEIVLQHNDMIVTNSDMGLNVKCQYDLRNQTVYNNINLDDFMAGREPIDIASQSAVVRSPNISMQILRHDGNQIAQAQVGDPLLLRFQITDERSPFEIFVRDLYAMDGAGGAEIMLIDGEGCPTDPTIMTAMSNVRNGGQTLEAQFDAFKFPTSETVAFRGLVSPCIPHCEPVHCQNRVYDGTIYEAESYGKRKRRRRRRSIHHTEAVVAGKSGDNQRQQPEEVIVRNSIEIKDKFFSNEQNDDNSNQSDELRKSAYDLTAATGAQQSLVQRLGQSYLRAGGLMFLFGVLLLAQSALLAAWLTSSKRSNKSETSKIVQNNNNHSLAGNRQQQQQVFAAAGGLLVNAGATGSHHAEVRMCRH